MKESIDDPGPGEGFCTFQTPGPRTAGDGQPGKWRSVLSPSRSAMLLVSSEGLGSGESPWAPDQPETRGLETNEIFHG